MITFKEYISESEIIPIETGVISAQELLKYISKAKLDAITKHKWFRDYMSTAQVVRIAVGFRYRLDRNGFEQIDVAHGPIGDESLRRLLTFQLRYKGRSVSQVHLYQNWNNEKLSSGGIKWEHIKSLNDTK